MVKAMTVVFLISERFHGASAHVNDNQDMIPHIGLSIADRVATIATFIPQHECSQAILDLVETEHLCPSSNPGLLCKPSRFLLQLDSQVAIMALSWTVSRPLSNQ